MNLLDARLLHAFIAVAEERHFGRAAKRLHLSQPPVSQRVRQLEENLGTPLFIRSTRQVSLTPAGAELYRRAIQLTQQAAAAEAAIKRLGEGAQGDLRIGFTRTVASRLLPRLLAHYREHKPDVTLHLHEDWSAQLVQLLLSEKLDLTLLRRSEANNHPDIRFILVDSEPFWLAMPKGHRLARRRKVHPSELSGETLVGYSASTALYFHEALKAILAHYGVVAHIQHTSAVPTVLALVAAGMGVTLVPKSAAGLRPADTVAIPLDDPDGVANAVLYAAILNEEQRPIVTGVVDDLLKFGPPPRPIPLPPPALSSHWQ